MKNKYIETGKIVGTHGVRGEMRVQPWCDSPDFLVGFKTLYLDRNGNAKLEIIKSRVHKSIVLLQCRGIDSVESAERFRDKVLYIDREDAILPEGSHFVDDLIGCDVFDTASGEKLGTLCDVSVTGANDVWHIKGHDKREYLIPAIPDVVDSVDTDNSRISITPLKGIFDDED